MVGARGVQGHATGAVAYGRGHFSQLGVALLVPRVVQALPMHIIYPPMHIISLYPGLYRRFQWRP